MRSASTSSSRRSSASARCRPTRPKSRRPSSRSTRRCAASSWEGGQRVVWEYWDGRDWEPLSVDDETHGFTRSGFTFFVAPDDWMMSSKFTEERYWLRARLEQGGYVKPPRVAHGRHERGRRVSTTRRSATRRSAAPTARRCSSSSSCAARCSTTRSSRSARSRRRRPRRSPTSAPNAVRTVEPENPQNNEVWVRYKRVESFFASGPRSRHYTLDYVTGVDRVRRWPPRHRAARGQEQRSSRVVPHRRRLARQRQREHADVARPRARVHRQRHEPAARDRAARIARRSTKRRRARRTRSRAAIAR